MSNEENFKVRVICPVCDASNYLNIPKANILQSQKGLTTVFVHNKLVCEHSFQIFIDKQGKVRGHETPDFELKFTATEEESAPEIQKEFEGKGVLLILNAVFGNEIFLKCLRSAFNHSEIICITENNIILEQFKVLFEKIFGVYTPDITVVRLNEYNKNVRNKVFASKSKNILVFNADLSTIIKQPRDFEKKFRVDKYKLEQTIVTSMDLKSLNDEQIIETINPSINNIFEAAKNLIDMLNHRKIKNRKEMGKKIQKMLGKVIICDIDAMDRILRYHFKYIPSFIDETAISRSGFKY